MDLFNIGTFLLGIGAVISATAAWKSGKKITAIDHAVNGKPPGAKTLQNQVADLHSDRPAPPPLPKELNDTAIKEMLQLLVADMAERRRAKDD